MKLEKEFLKKCGQRVRKYRNKRHLTQAELAEQADVSVIHVSHIETGTVSMSLDTLLTFCQILDITPNDILLDAYPVSPEEQSVFQESAQRLSEEDILLLRQVAGYLADREEK